MSTVSSNIISKHYCPQCSSFELLKLHRGFVQKRILNAENKLQCETCGEIFKSGAFDQNIPIETPSFLHTPSPIRIHKVTSETVKNFSGAVLEHVEGAPAALSTVKHAHVAVHDIPELSDEYSQIKAGEVVALAARRSNLNKAPPRHSRDSQLVDEVILIKEKQGAWPYMLGSLLVLFGAAYAFIWMPMTLNAGESNNILIDMSIGKPPLQATAVSKQAELLKEAKFESSIAVIQSKPQDSKARLERPLEVVTAGVNESVESEFQLAAFDSQEIKIEQDGIVVGKPSAVITKIVKAAPKVSSLQQENPRLAPDSGTKADIALGLLPTTRADKALVVSLPKDFLVKTVVDTALDEAIRPIKVPLPLASAQQHDAMKPNQHLPNRTIIASANEALAKPEIVTSTNKQIKVPKAPARLTQSSKIIVFTKQAAAILGVSSKDLSALTGVVSDKSIASVAAKPIIQKGQSANNQLLEKVSVKLIQQDLDRLLPN